MDEALLERIDRMFDYHPAKEGNTELYVQITQKVKELALLVGEVTPDSQEQYFALVFLQITRMLANAAIACNK